MKQKVPPMGPIDTGALALPGGYDFRFRFAVYGDNQQGVEVHTRIVEAILQSGAEVVLHTGDYVQNGSKRWQWDEHFRKPAQPLLDKLIFLGVPGNHDKHSRRYFETVMPPGGKSWFTFRYLSTTFLGIDTNTNLRVSGEQGRWLDEELQNTGVKWKIVFLHEAPYSSSWPWPGGALKSRKHVMPMLEKHGVNLVFAGHIHNYERFHKDGVPYIATGGGGGTLSKPEQLKNPYKKWTLMKHHFCTADVYRDRIVVLARDLQGAPFDGVVVHQDGRLEEVELATRRGYEGPWPKKYPVLHFRRR